MPDVDHQTPNPDLPPVVADAFVAFMREHDILLDYSLESLTDELDKALDLRLYRADTVVYVRAGANEMEFDLKSAASAYLGQTLVQQFNGDWEGFFATKAGLNFYTSQLLFGDYCIHPIQWISYRVSNGRKEGSVADWLARITPSIKARRDLNKESRP